MHYDPIFVPHYNLERVSLSSSSQWRDAYRWIDFHPAFLRDTGTYIAVSNPFPPLFILHFVIGVN